MGPAEPAGQLHKQAAKGIIKPPVRTEERPHPLGHRYFGPGEGSGIKASKFDIFDMKGENLFERPVETVASVSRIGRKMLQPPVPGLHLADLGPSCSSHKRNHSNQDKEGHDHPEGIPYPADLPHAEIKADSRPHLAKEGSRCGESPCRQSAADRLIAHHDGQEGHNPKEHTEKSQNPLRNYHG